jgi:hypothetical protein
MTTTTIIACAGAGQAWTARDEDDKLVCPECLLTPDELQIKLRVRGDKVSPATIPSHDIEVEGTELKFVLTNGEFQVHTPSCPTLKKDLKVSDYERPGTLVARDRRDAVLQLWDDQIGEDERIVDKDSPTESELAGYANGTNFHRCVNRVWSVAVETKPIKVKRDAKRMLANLMVEALAAQITQILDTNLADTDESTADARLVLSGMDNDEIRKTVSHWIHHFPADRERWVASGMPKPDRSNWQADEPAESAA